MTRNLPVAQQPTTVLGFPIVPEVITEDKWHQPWTDPTRRKIGASQYQGYFEPPEYPNFPVTRVVTTALGSQVSYRVRFFFQSLAIPVLPPVPEVVTVDKWFEPWTDPVRTRPGLLAAQQDVSADGEIIPKPSTLIEGWQYPWSEPVRLRALPVSEQSTTVLGSPPPALTFASAQVFSTIISSQVFIYQSLAQPAFTPPPEVITVDKWFKSWAEPVRLKQGLLTDLQQAVAAPPSYPILNRLIQWFVPLSEPVREKKGLWARLQQFFSTDTKPPALPTVTLVMAVTETNKDSAAFGIYVYNQAGPGRCAVSIKEIRKYHGALSVAVTTLPASSGAVGYVAEDGVTQYVAEDGITPYITET
jgi:hypothetical protein